MDEFLLHMFDAIKLWKQPRTGKLYVLSGHSRFEAFKRLSKEPFKSDVRVIEFCKKYNISFDKIPAIILPDTVSLQDAKFTALTSNSLATHESDMERASFYREIRMTNKWPKGEYERRLHQYEKANAKKIDAFSYLNPNGKTAEALESFELNGDANGDLRKVAYWVGIVRKKEPGVSNLHENELFDWLFFKGNYGTQEGQFFKFENFWTFLSGHIEALKEKGEFKKNNSLNLESVRSVSLAMQTYMQLLRELRQKKALVNKAMNNKIINVSKDIISGKKSTDLFTSTDEIIDYFEVPLSFKHAFAALEDQLSKLVKTVQTDDDVKKVNAEFTQLLTSITKQIHEHKNNRHKYVEASKQEQRLF